MSDVKGLSVTIGIPCGALIPWQTTMSLTAAVRIATKAGIDLTMLTIAMNSDVCDARSAVLDRFLEGKSSRLFWIDSDIDFSPKDFMRMVTLSTKYPVVAATYPMKREDRAVIINEIDPNATEFEINQHGLVKIASTGLGFTIVQREVLEKLAATKPRTYRPQLKRDQLHAFTQSEDGGEDITFFREVRGLGYDVWLDPTVELGHVGPYVYKRDVVEALGLTSFYAPKE